MGNGHYALKPLSRLRGEGLRLRAIGSRSAERPNAPRSGRGAGWGEGRAPANQKLRTTPKNACATPSVSSAINGLSLISSGST